MCSAPRTLNYGLAINEAIHQLMEADPSVLVMGRGDQPWYVGNTAQGLLGAGPERVIDRRSERHDRRRGQRCHRHADDRRPPADGLHALRVRRDGQRGRQLALRAGAPTVPVVFWGIVNRAGNRRRSTRRRCTRCSRMFGGQVVAPSTPYDAKGLMIAAVRDPNPVVFVDERWLYGMEAPVPEEVYEVEIGTAAVRREGSDVTIVAFSYLAPRALMAAEELAAAGVSAEFVDLRTLKPLDTGTVFASVRKTGRAVVCDIGWRTGGLGGEVAAQIAEACWSELEAPVKRLALPDVPAPAARTLEAAYYVDTPQIVAAGMDLVRR
jgi:pyruvate dehydrogenase E1 component beta subunit